MIGLVGAIGLIAASSLAFGGDAATSELEPARPAGAGGEDGSIESAHGSTVGRESEGGGPVEVVVDGTKLLLEDEATLVLPDGRRVSIKVEPAPKRTVDAVEIVFVLDTTGSMAGLIEGAKQQIWSIASHEKQHAGEAEVRMGLVGYRDRDDEYTTKMTPLTADLDAVYADLMQYRAAGGGDTPESVNEALHRAFTEMQWSTEGNVDRVVFLVGDAPPKEYADDVDYTDSVPAALQQRGIRVYAIQCGNITGTAEHWKAIAALGGGDYTRVAQSGGVQVVTTPFDEELARLNAEITATMIPYGDQAAREFALRQRTTADRLDATATVAASAARVGFRAAHAEDMFGMADLTTQLLNASLSVEEIDASKLPEDLRAMGEDGRAAHIVGLVERRRAALDRIEELMSERRAWIAANGVKLEDSEGFDGFMARRRR
jgi:Mg-chelatase subunit ChlD